MKKQKINNAAVLSIVIILIGTLTYFNIESLSEIKKLTSRVSDLEHILVESEKEISQMDSHIFKETNSSFYK